MVFKQGHKINVGRKFSEKTKQLLREKNLGEKNPLNKNFDARINLRKSILKSWQKKEVREKHLGKNHPMWGKKHKNSTLELMRENSGAIKYMRGKTFEEIYGNKKSEEIKKAKSISIKNFIEKNPKFKNLLKEARSLLIMPFQDTSIEIKIQNFLKELKIGFFTHYYCKEIAHSYQCDIFIPVQKNRNRFIKQPIIIECDGDYYHCNSEIYEIPINEMQREQIEADKIRTRELLQRGYKVIRLWENEINKLKLEDFGEIIR
jgi:hypothetical protein